MIDAFRVEYLPEGVDPLDVRYNVVRWVNRATRGWSYGQVIEDPRTGEIIRGQVLLGSLRVRQDMLIFEGLVGAGQTGSGGPNDPVRAALARIRQLAAHEVGHALGIAHNFAASIAGPLFGDGLSRAAGEPGRWRPDLADAYGVGIGRWDRSRSTGSTAPTPTRTASRGWPRRSPRGCASSATTRRGRSARRSRRAASGTTAPIRSPSSADDGGAPRRRRAASARARLYPGEPVANLRRKFVPIWLLHRYQVEAAAKLVGGVDFAYSLQRRRPGGGARGRAGRQRARARRAARRRLSPEALTVPPPLLPYLSAGWSGSPDRQETIEIFRTAGGPIFDPLVASEIGGALTLNSLLVPERLNRLEIADAQADADAARADDLIERLIERALAPRRPASRRCSAGSAPPIRARRSPGSSAIRRCRRRSRSRCRTGSTGSPRQLPHGGGGAIDWAAASAACSATARRSPPRWPSQRRMPQIPPGMPIGGGEGGLAGLSRTPVLES